VCTDQDLNPEHSCDTTLIALLVVCELTSRAVRNFNPQHICMHRHFYFFTFHQNKSYRCGTWSVFKTICQWTWNSDYSVSKATSNISL